MTNRGAFPGLAGAGADGGYLRGTPVAATAPTAGQGLVYNGAAGRWEPATTPVPPLTYGPASTLLKTRAALAKVIAGTAHMKVVCIGDSTTGGLTSGGPTNTDAVTYPGYLVSRLAARGIPSVQYAKGYLDARITLTGGATGQGFTPGPGFYYIPGGAVGNIAFNPGFNTDTLEVGWSTNTGYGTSTVNANGGASLGTINHNASLSLNLSTYTTTLGANTWNLNANNAGGAHAHFWSLRAYDSTAAKGVHIQNWGLSGTTTLDWVTKSGNAWQNANGFTVMQPNLTIISLGVNDALTLTSQQWFNNMKTIIGWAKGVGSDVLLCSLVPSSDSARTKVQNEIQARMQELAASQGCAWLDAPWSRWGGDWNTANGLGLMTDSLHGNSAGYSDWANVISQVIVNA